MKTAKIVIIVILIIFIGSCGYVAIQPDSYDVYRTRVIQAPAEVIFTNINDFKNWEAWSPWIEKDPSIIITYPEQTSGVDGSYSWTSDDGNGTMKTLTVSPYDSISHEIKFENFPPSNVYWHFEKADEGTKVTWGMKANNLPFLLKFFSTISGGMDNMVGPDYERGLEKLDSVIVESMNKFKITVEGEKEYGGGFYLYTTTNATNENISATMAKEYGKIGMFMGKPAFGVHNVGKQDCDRVYIFSDGPVRFRLQLTGNLPWQQVFQQGKIREFYD